MIWNPNKECMSRDEMSALQGKRLNKIVTYVYHNVPFYRHKLQELDIRPDDIQTIEDIKRLPFTTKQDLRDNYPFGLQAAPRSEIIRVHASSGTTGNPTIVGYTRKDIGVWSECMARCLTAYGITRNDTFSVSYGYGLFTGGLGAHYGVEHLGASVVPASTGNTEKHLKLIRDLGVTGIACTPSYALYLAETMDRLGITIHHTAVDHQSGMSAAQDAHHATRHADHRHTAHQFQGVLPSGERITGHVVLQAIRLPTDDRDAAVDGHLAQIVVFHLHPDGSHVTDGQQAVDGLEAHTTDTCPDLTGPAGDHEITDLVTHPAADKDAVLPLLSRRLRLNGAIFCRGGLIRRIV